MSGQAMDCNELVELVTAYLDGALDDDTRALFEGHLQECDGCENYLEQFRVTIGTVAAISEDDLDPSFRDRLLSTFREWRWSSS